MDDDQELQKLRARVANLEMALHGMWAMLQDLQPPATQQAIGDMMREHFQPVDIIAVVRHNAKLAQGQRAKAAQEGNFFDRGFNYLFILKKPEPVERRP